MPPPRRSSRGNLTIPGRVMAAASAVVPPGLGGNGGASAGANSNPASARQQLLPQAAGAPVAMKVDGHRASVTLSKSGLRYGRAGVQGGEG